MAGKCPDDKKYKSADKQICKVIRVDKSKGPITKCENIEGPVITCKDGNTENKYKCNDKKHNLWHYECCQCRKNAKKGGFVNLSKSEAHELTQQLQGKTNKSTKIIYGGEKGKIIGLDKSKNLIIQTNNGIHKVNTENVKLNDKYIL